MAKNIEAYKIGYKSCIYCTVSLITITILSIGISIIVNQQWKDISSYFINYSKIEVVPQLIGLFTIPSIIFIFSALYYSLSDEKKVWGIIIIIFSSFAVITLELAYFMDVGLAYPTIDKGQLSVMEIFLIVNPNSLSRALRNFGFFILSMALACIPYALNKSRIELIIRVVSIICGVLGILYVPNLFLENKYVTVTVLVCWNIIVPIIFLLLAYYFKNKIVVINKKSVKGIIKVKKQSYESENYYNI